MSDERLLAEAKELEEELRGIGHLDERAWEATKRAAKLIQQMRVRIEATLLVLLVLLAGCDILSPTTELSVENETGAALEVLAAPCGSELALFAYLEAAGRHVEEVEPGCYDLEGWTDDARMGAVTINVVDGGLHRVPFHGVDE